MPSYRNEPGYAVATLHTRITIHLTDEQIPSMLATRSLFDVVGNGSTASYLTQAVLKTHVYLVCVYGYLNEQTISLIVKLPRSSRSPPLESRFHILIYHKMLILSIYIYIKIPLTQAL